MISEPNGTFSITIGQQLVVNKSTISLVWIGPPVLNKPFKKRGIVPLSFGGMREHEMNLLAGMRGYIIEGRLFDAKYNLSVTQSVCKSSAGLQ